MDDHSRREDALSPEAAARVARIIGSKVGELLGISIVEAGTDKCVAKLRRSDAIMNTNGRVNGGIISAFIDKAATAAAWAHNQNGPDARGTTISLTVNYLNAGGPHDLFATATVLRRGRSIVFVNVDVADEGGTPVAQGTAAYKLDI